MHILDYFLTPNLPEHLFVNTQNADGESVMPSNMKFCEERIQHKLNFRLSVDLHIVVVVCSGTCFIIDDAIYRLDRP